MSLVFTVLNFKKFPERSGQEVIGVIRGKGGVCSVGSKALSALCAGWSLILIFYSVAISTHILTHSSSFLHTDEMRIEVEDEMDTKPTLVKLIEYKHCYATMETWAACISLSKLEELMRDQIPYIDVMGHLAHPIFLRSLSYLYKPTKLNQCSKPNFKVVE